MDMDQSAVFLAGAVLTMMGLVVIVAGLIVINNLLHKYWKPVQILTRDSWSLFGHHDSNTYRFMTHEEAEAHSKEHTGDKDAAKKLAGSN